MAQVRPFRGLRFTSAAGPIDQLTAPPYDVLSPEQRASYAAKSPYNIVHLTLPESTEGDRSKFVKYARSSAALHQWREENILKAEDSPSFYRTVQEFKIEGLDEPVRRTALMASLKVEPYEAGVVLPHEQTFPKHKEDRLRLLEATRTHLESIFGLYDDPSGSIHALATSAPAEHLWTMTDPDGVIHSFEKISSPDATEAIAAAFADQRLWIADGHHRYETALGFRAQLGPKDHLIPEDFLLIGLTSLEDPGLVMLPTHRIVHPSSLGPDELLQKLEPFFNAVPVEVNELAQEFQGDLRAPQTEIGLLLPGGRGYRLTLKSADAITELQQEFGPDLGRLDVVVLHRLIFERALGMVGLDRISYTRSVGEAVVSARNVETSAWLMHPPLIDEMRTIALRGAKMPQKSTYYYPKMLSGAVMWSMSDFSVS